MTDNSEILDRDTRDREKIDVALNSVVAAVFLTSIKLIVGLMTGSLGILSEAAHSGLDFAAAVITLFAVRFSSQPADGEHTYGHGKIENLSALFETLLLLVTCVWIIYEAIQRLFIKDVAIEANFWAFLVMGISIAVDTSRSRALYRVARKYKSQALEADALHFSTDIWSSAVVIGGLILVRLAGLFGAQWLVKADAVAALAVAGIVVFVSIRLGIKTVSGLVDAIPPGLRDEVSYAVKVPGVLHVEKARVRISGSEVFADVTLAVSYDTTLEEAHDIASLAESAVRQILPGADVVVHIEPLLSKDGGIASVVRHLAIKHRMNAHGIRIYDIGENHILELHIEVEDTLRVDEAHSNVSNFESEVKRELPNFSQIITHIEPKGERLRTQIGTLAEEALILRTLQAMKKRLDLDCHFHEIEVRRVAGELIASLHCTVDPNTDIVDAHALTESVENELRSNIPYLTRIAIHVEPPIIDEV